MAHKGASSWTRVNIVRLKFFMLKRTMQLMQYKCKSGRQSKISDGFKLWLKHRV